MKRIAAMLTAMVFLTAGGCGLIEPEQSESSAETTAASETSKTSETSAAETETVTAAQEEILRQSCTKTIDVPEKPELAKVTLTADCAGNLRKNASVDNVYNINILHSGVVGLVGVPIELEYNDTVTSPVLTFTYNKNELRGIPAKNLIVLHYNEADAFYDTIESELDARSCIVSFKVKEPGAYMLADAYQWYGTWGMDVSEYEYDRDTASYITDWERECYTGDIMKLADKDWALANAPNFTVATAEQLASVVYYVNGIGDNGSVSIALLDDIDLTGYDWVPMGWRNASDHEFIGELDGRGHTINGMTMLNCDGYGDVGFVGYSGARRLEVHDISFTNARVHGGSCTGIVGGEVYGTIAWSNIKVSGEISGVYNDYGAIVGRESALSFKNCSAEVTVDGKHMEYFSYRQKLIGETEVTETFNLTLNDDKTVTRDDHEGFRNLGWLIKRDDVQILQRSAEDPRTKEPELTLDTHRWVGDQPGKYTIYLVAYINGAYIRVSNVIEYTL